MTVAACPTEEVFVMALTGDLPAAQSSAFDQHVQLCAACASLLRAMGGSAAPIPATAVSGTHATLAAGSAPAVPAPTTTEIGPGTRIHQYELIRELGRGGMGMVWAARDVKLGRRVAMKFLLDATRGVAERFLVEARATAHCSHDNIVIIHEVDEIGDTPYMVLELLEGQPLRDVIVGYGPGAQLPASRVVELLLPVARALVRAHELGIVHRDLKPENVFVTPGGQVKVLDFGIAKARGAADHIRSEGFAVGIGDTRAGTLMGTLPYMSPEQMGGEEVDQRTDVWAFGIMMFEMLAGRHPIKERSLEGLFSVVTSPEPLPAVASIAPAIPSDIAAIVDGCLVKSAGARVASAAELVERLEAQLPGRSGRALADGESPFPGLTSFDEDDADRFFGRARDIANMTARVRERPLTGVIGPSGAGKSSFVRAGVGPTLKASGERWEIVTFRPGRQPLAALASVLQRFAPEVTPDRLRTEAGRAGAVLRTRARQLDGRILLFIDQLEELYTLVASAKERRAFTAALTAIADDPATPVRVVVSMRSDFLDRVAEDPRLTEELSRGLVFLPPPDRDGLREALTAPVALVGYHYESATVVDDMLDALAGTPGALPLLQFAAAKLWDARDRKQRLLTAASYAAIGGLSGALAAHADDVIAVMSAPARKLTQKMFRRLVTPERTRAIVELDDLVELAQVRDDGMRVVDQLVAARLLVVQKRDGGGTVELVHESLIERWPALHRWLEEDQEDAAYLAQLAAASKQWDGKGRAAGLLWRGEAMEEARRWRAQRPRELGERDRAFLDAPDGARAARPAPAQRRARRRVRAARRDRGRRVDRAGAGEPGQGRGAPERGARAPERGAGEEERGEGEREPRGARSQGGGARGRRGRSRQAEAGRRRGEGRRAAASRRTRTRQRAQRAAAPGQGQAARGREDPHGRRAEDR